MADIIGYILRRQENFESKLLFLFGVTITHMVISEIRNRKYKREIKALRDEIKELKHVEGE